jgi:hypothetical protein
VAPSLLPLSSLEPGPLVLLLQAASPTVDDAPITTMTWKSFSMFMKQTILPIGELGTFRDVSRLRHPWHAERSGSSPPVCGWQNGYTERWVGTLRRQLLDHLAVPLGSGICSVARAVQPPGGGRVVAFPRVGGLHRYSRAG